jgi:Tfp pilus assembly protein PilO
MRIDLNQPATLREQIMFGLVALALVVFFLRVILAPLSQRIGEHQARRNALRLERDSLIKFAQMSPLVDKQAFSRKRNLKTRILLGEIRSDFENFQALLAEITSPRFLGGVVIDNLSHQVPVSDQGYSRTDFTLVVRGGFNSVMQYMGRLEQFPALFRIEQFDFKTSEGQAQDVVAELVGRFFSVQGPPDSGIAVKTGETP